MYGLVPHATHQRGRLTAGFMSPRWLYSAVSPGTASATTRILRIAMPAMGWHHTCVTATPHTARRSHRAPHHQAGFVQQGAGNRVQRPTVGFLRKLEHIEVPSIQLRPNSSYESVDAAACHSPQSTTTPSENARNGGAGRIGTHLPAHPLEVAELHGDQVASSVRWRERGDVHGR